MPASRVLMVKPRSFRANEQTAATNSFQDSLVENVDLSVVLTEFENLRQVLENAGIKVVVQEEPANTDTPDSLYPNNWFAQLPTGQTFLFPMMAENRRREIHLEWLPPSRELIDLRFFERENIFLEGTGSLILDHRNRQGFACFSDRTHPRAIAEFTRRSGYRIFTFHSLDPAGSAVYHTNVIMALGENVAVICPDGIENQHEKTSLLRQLSKSGFQTLLISMKQVESFAGNMIHLQNSRGQKFWICSTAAFESLSSDQINLLKSDGEILTSAAPTIERVGGGGVRCMIAELWPA